MPTQFMAALLSFTGTIVGSFSGVLVSSARANRRIGQLEQKMALHHHVVERAAVMEHNIKTAFQLINEQKGRLTILEG